VKAKTALCPPHRIVLPTPSDGSRVQFGKCKHCDVVKTYKVGYDYIDWSEMRRKED